jgi:hypothetical protein
MFIPLINRLGRHAGHHESMTLPKFGMIQAINTWHHPYSHQPQWSYLQFMKRTWPLVDNFNDQKGVINICLSNDPNQDFEIKVENFEKCSRWHVRAGTIKYGFASRTEMREMQNALLRDLATLHLWIWWLLVQQSIAEPAMSDTLQVQGQRDTVKLQDGRVLLFLSLPGYSRRIRARAGDDMAGRGGEGDSWPSRRRRTPRRRRRWWRRGNLAGWGCTGTPPPDTITARRI